MDGTALPSQWLVSRVIHGLFHRAGTLWVILLYWFNTKLMREKASGIDHRPPGRTCIVPAVKISDVTNAQLFHCEPRTDIFRLYGVEEY